MYAVCVVRWLPAWLIHTVLYMEGEIAAGGYGRCDSYDSGQKNCLWIWMCGHNWCHLFRRKCYAMSCSSDFSSSELSYSLCSQVLMCGFSNFPLLFLRLPWMCSSMHPMLCAFPPIFPNALVLTGHWLKNTHIYSVYIDFSNLQLEFRQHPITCTTLLPLSLFVFSSDYKGRQNTL